MIVDISINTINDLLTSIGSNPFLNIFSALLAIMGLILAFYFYMRGKKDKRPFYAISGYNVINDVTTNNKNLQINYKTHPIRNFTISYLSFWNEGSEAIREVDIPETNPLLITTKNDYEILESAIVKTIDKNNSNKFNLETINNKTVKLSFKYMDKNDGLKIMIAHTGKSIKDITFEGKIIGVNEIRNAEGKKTRDNIKNTSSSNSLGAIFAIIIMVVFLYYVITLLLQNATYFCTTSIAVVIGVIIIQKLWFFITGKSKVPKDLM